MLLQSKEKPNLAKVPNKAEAESKPNRVPKRLVGATDPVFRLVLLLIDVLSLAREDIEQWIFYFPDPNLASENVPHGAHPLRLAHHARVPLPPLAVLRDVARDEPLLHQLVASHLPAVQVPNTDTTLEEAAVLGATSCKFAHLLQ